MVSNHLPIVRHVLGMTSIRRERRLPFPGIITVRVREKVQAADVVAEAQPMPKHYFLDISAGLGVPAAEVRRFIRAEIGDPVEAGQLIAGPVGLMRRTVRAHADGRIIRLAGGKLLLEARATPYAVHAGFPGEVVATDGSRVVTIETTGALAQGVWGNGRRGWGVLRIIGDSPQERLQTDKLDIILRGAILVAGSCDHAAPLHQATELSVRGLVLGSMAAELIPVARRLSFPVLLTEGFGSIPMSRPIYDLLSANAGREGAAEAIGEGPFGLERPEVIIPLSGAQVLDRPERVVQLKSGVRVRATRNPYHGAVGTIAQMLPRPESFSSGLLARSAAVEVEGLGRIVVPLANLEVIG